MQQAKAGSDFLLVRGTRVAWPPGGCGRRQAGRRFPVPLGPGRGRSRDDALLPPPAPRLWARAVFVPRNDRVRVKMRTGVMKTATNWNSPLFF